MPSLRWETFIAFSLRAAKREAYTRFRRFAFHQTTDRLRTFIPVKTNAFLFWKARSTFRLAMKKSQPSPARSFKDRAALHTVLKTTRNDPRAFWGLSPRQDLRISSKNLRNPLRRSIRRRYRLAKTKSINCWRLRQNTAFRFCRRTNRVIPFSRSDGATKKAMVRKLHAFGELEAIGGRALCQSVLCS